MLPQILSDMISWFRQASSKLRGRAPLPVQNSITELGRDDRSSEIFL